MEIETEIKTAIQDVLPDAEIVVMDPMNDGVHLEAVVISPHFEGMNRVQQHRIVMNSLKKQFQTVLHALKLQTFTPKQWSDVRHQYEA